jgi:acylphosphatase
MRREAERLGVTGWVCNRMDGGVEAVVQGSPDAVEAITHWARRGPEDARVTGVEVSAAAGDFFGFEKR